MKNLNPITSPLSINFPLQPNSVTWVEVNKSAVEHNIQTYKNIVGPLVNLAVVVKSNAYGHGILNIATIAEQHHSVAYLCVVNLSEALYLRSAGITKPILVLSYIDAPIESALLNNIDLVVFDFSTAQSINLHATTLGLTAHVHVKIDTGLSRLGYRDIKALEMVLRITALKNMSIKGIFTHLANSEHKDQHFVHQQLQNFDAVLHNLDEQNIHIPFKHTSCSAALLSTQQTHYNFARLGIGTYGLWPSSDNKTLAQLSLPHVKLKPALTWKTKIIHIKTVPVESTIGYDRTYQTNRDTKIAVLPIGYYEGYDRKFSNRGVVLINNRCARVIGRISMNLTTVDITDIPGAEVGMPVTLLGDNGPVSAEALAEALGTINYEVVTRINPCIPRVLT